MTEREPRADPESNDDLDTGEPIEMLRGFGEEPGAGFLGRIRSAIQRRLLASQLLDLSWFTPVLVLFEYLKVAFGFFERVRREEGDAD